jgi:lysophospholipase L1-like esterase
MPRSHIQILAVMAAILLTLTACQESEPAVPKVNPHVDPAKITQYVAMGDSFTSGPGISPNQKDSGVCLRSERNYPHQIAKDLGVGELKDVSCAGASTEHVTQDIPVQDPRVSTVKAQVDAVSSATRLVTISIGYNNDQLAAKLSGVCLSGPQAKAKNCQEFVDESMPEMLDSQRDEVVTVLKLIRRKARHATVVLVGYLPILPTRDSCPTSGSDPGVQSGMFDAESAIEDTLRAAANEAGTEFVSMRRAAVGHGVCDGDAAWVNGGKAREGDGVVFHPRASGMAAVAAAIEDHLERLHSR